MAELSGPAYMASVKIGTACCAAFAKGATHEDVIAALRHCTDVGEQNRDLGIPEAALALRIPKEVG